MVIKGYNFDENKEFSTGSAKAWHARDRYGNEFFLKCYNDVIRPNTERLSAEMVETKNKECEDFTKRRLSILKALKPLGNGNIVIPSDFFEYDRHFYQATGWKDIKSDKISDIAKLPDEKKLIILKTAAHNLRQVHERKVMHLDIKPDNMPVGTIAATGRTICLLMDFDESVVVGDPLPSPDEMRVTELYLSPEHFFYKNKIKGLPDISLKSDIFSLGICFYEYWTGDKLEFNNKDGSEMSLFPAVNVAKGCDILFKPGIPEFVKALIRDMLKLNPDERPDIQTVFDRLNSPNDNPAPTPAEYTVRFDGNGSDSGSMAPLKMTVGKSSALPANMYARTGYTFIGWNTSADGRGTSLANRANITDLSKTSGTEAVLWAQWKKESPVPTPAPTPTPSAPPSGYRIGAKAPAAFTSIAISGNNVTLMATNGARISYPIATALRIGWIEKG